MRWFKVALLLSLLWGGYDWYRSRPVPHNTPGSIVTELPRQTSTPALTAQLGRYQLTRQARFEIEALVLGREDYSHDRGADLSPTDLALGWGPMSDPAVLRQLQISQGGRFFYWRYQNQPPVPVDQIVSSSANMHLIPADESVAAKLRRVRVGQVVTFQGYLVNVKGHDGFTWNSSLTRTDTGAGACELVLVEELNVQP